jgi:hypothetical protein
VVLGQTDPAPVVDLAMGRTRALEAYERIRATA